MKLRSLAIIGLTVLSAVSCKAGDPVQYKIKVVKEYDHDRGAYTQGLFFEDGKLYESTGQYGESSFRQVDLATGKVLRQLNFGRKYFAEGSVMLDGSLFMLTWTNKEAFVYDAKTLKYEKTFRYPREGWGLTTDGKQLIASDGSSVLYFLDKEFNVQKTLTVRHKGRPIRFLNELEWVDGKIWANVYLTESIVIIDPSDGEVVGVVDCSGLLPLPLRRQDTDVLNGIAVSADGKIYLTGKNWPKLYEVKLVKK